MVTPTRTWTSAIGEVSVPINESAAGDLIIVPAAVGQVVRLYRLAIKFAAATNFTFKDGPGNDLSGPLPMDAGDSIVLDDSGDPWYQTAAGNALIFNSSSAVQISGTAWFIQV